MPRMSEIRDQNRQQISGARRVRCSGCGKRTAVVIGDRLLWLSSQFRLPRSVKLADRPTWRCHRCARWNATTSP